MRALGTSVAVVGFVLASVVGCATTPPPRAPLDTTVVTTPPRAERSRADVVAAFAELKSLAGSWEGVSSTGRTSRVGYRVSAGDSVLVETWTQSRGREALTLYHVDGDELLATHYCPKGNAVNLRWSGGDLAAGMSFEFVDGTNLDDAKQSHQREFRLEFDGADAFRRGETYVANVSTDAEIAAQPAGELIAYRRVDPAITPG